MSSTTAITNSSRNTSRLAKWFCKKTLLQKTLSIDFGAMDQLDHSRARFRKFSKLNTGPRSVGNPKINKNAAAKSHNWCSATRGSLFPVTYHNSLHIYASFGIPCDLYDVYIFGGRYARSNSSTRVKTKVEMSQHLVLI